MTDVKTGDHAITVRDANKRYGDFVALDQVDFANLRSRLSQNGVQEKLTKLWIARCLRRLDSEAVTV